MESSIIGSPSLESSTHIRDLSSYTMKQKFNITFPDVNYNNLREIHDTRSGTYLSSYHFDIETLNLYECKLIDGRGNKCNYKWSQITDMQYLYFYYIPIAKCAAAQELSFKLTFPHLNFADFYNTFEYDTDDFIYKQYNNDMLIAYNKDSDIWRLL